MKQTTKYCAVSASVSLVSGLLCSAIILPGFSVVGRRAQMSPDVAAEYAWYDVVLAVFDAVFIVMQIGKVFALPALMLAVVVFAYVVVMRRPEQWKAGRGCCQDCFYQLLEDQEICPECGTPVDRAKAWPTPVMCDEPSAASRRRARAAALIGIVIGCVAGIIVYSWISVALDARDAAAFVREVEEGQERGQKSHERDTEHRQRFFSFFVYVWTWDSMNGYSLDSESVLDF